MDRKPLKVFLMDFWCIVPYYTTYLCASLAQRELEVTLGSIRYHLDPGCFARHGVRNRPGLLDVVGRLGIRRPALRRALKLIESCLNMLAFALRSLVSRPDVLHVQYLQLLEKKLPFEIWLCAFLKKRGAKMVYTVHNILPFHTGNLHHNRYRKVYQMADALICHTRETRRQLIEEFGAAADKIWVIPHGPMFHDLQPPSPEQSRAEMGFRAGECVVVFQGFIAPYKGTEFLLDAWQRVQQRNLAARLVVAGTGEKRWLQAVEDKVRELGLEESVTLDFRFMPFRQMPVLLQAADILVYPYREITQSGSLLTALTFGKAVVATTLPTFREFLEDGETARLAPYGDADAFAAALIRLIEDPAERQRIGRNAAALPRPWAEIAGQTRSCYAAVCASARKGREAASATFPKAS